MREFNSEFFAPRRQRANVVVILLIRGVKPHKFLTSGIVYGWCMQGARGIMYRGISSLG